MRPSVTRAATSIGARLAPSSAKFCIELFGARYAQRHEVDYRAAVGSCSPPFGLRCVPDKATGISNETASSSDSRGRSQGYRQFALSTPVAHRHKTRPVEGM